MVIIFLLIKFENEDPIFKQKRLGLNQKIFTIFKFRSLKSNTRNIESNKIKELNFIRFGKTIRRLNIDELPQLINILVGNMSLVGPRPCLTSQKELIKLRFQNKIFTLKPGLTGLAQINSYDNMDTYSKVSYEKKYLENISFISDCIIILKTFRYLLKTPPKY